jgi:hypothetical protein
VLRRVKKAIVSENILFLNLQNLDLLEVNTLEKVIGVLETLININLLKKQS